MNSITKPEYFYKYVTLQGAANIFYRKGLKWSCPLEFNDPFDLHRDIGFGFSDEDYFEHFKKRAIELRGNGEPIRNNSEVWENIRSKSQWITDDECESFWGTQKNEVMENHHTLLRQFKNSWNEQVPRYRVLCLSENESDLLMWAHYADMHRGAVIRFKCINDQKSHFKDAKPVIYSQSFPFLASLDNWVNQCIGVGVQLDDKEIFHRIVHTKSEHWGYEREWRCIVDSEFHLKVGQVQLYDIMPEEIDGIIFGCRADLATSEIIKKYIHLELPHVKFQHATLKQNEYNLEYL